MTLPDNVWRLPILRELLDSSSLLRFERECDAFVSRDMAFVREEVRDMQGARPPRSQTCISVIFRAQKPKYPEKI